MESKHFLFVSADAALITDLAWQVHREGHDVKYYIEAESDQEIGDGFIPKTDDWREAIPRLGVPTPLQSSNIRRRWTALRWNR